jgi:hypothetical protein
MCKLSSRFVHPWPTVIHYFFYDLQVGTYNGTGQKYRGHYDIWLTNNLQELLVVLEDILVDPVGISGWVNGNLYVPTTETIGILPVPPDIRVLTGMTEFNRNLDQKHRHHYLASKQGTRKAILPIHTTAEHELFKNYMKSHSAFSSCSKGPDWPKCVKVWNEYADSHDDIFYKVRLTLFINDKIILIPFAACRTAEDIPCTLDDNTKYQTVLITLITEPSTHQRSHARSITLDSSTCGTSRFIEMSSSHFGLQSYNHGTSTTIHVTR